MDIFGISLEELEQFFLSRGLQKFRAKQVFHFLFEKKVGSFAKMQNLPKSCMQLLEENFSFFSLTLVKGEVSEDKETIKYLWKLPDGSLFESVLILSGDRRTLCVSSQVGCPGRCAFCASGKMGFIKNLSTSEILEQIYQVNLLLKEKNEKITHIVFMGMGEPLTNYENVTNAIKKINSKEGFNISQRRITLSTVGVSENIRALADDGFRVNLAFSLHEVDQESREKIIPFAKKYPLEDLLEALFYYSNKTKRDLTFEYTLIQGVNDSREKAMKLTEFLIGKQRSINLIPLNPIEKSSLKRPSKEVIEAFERVLVQKGLQVTRRYTKGKDIAAACGQLAILTRQDDHLKR